MKLIFIHLNILERYSLLGHQCTRILNHIVFAAANEVSHYWIKLVPSLIPPGLMLVVLVQSLSLWVINAPSKQDK